MDENIWGYLQPPNPALNHINFLINNPSVGIGRNPAKNSVILHGSRISNYHCVITWDCSNLDPGSPGPEVTVLDLSMNGTFICDALAYIHLQGVAHRDLKPQNILLTNEAPPNVKIVDFGLAKMIDNRTMLRTFCGTPDFIAPKIVGQSDYSGYDFLVDSWSVGVIAFEMLTMSRPFVKDHKYTEIEMQIWHRKINWEVLATAGISPNAQNFVKKLLKRNPLRRMSSKAALAHPWLKLYTSLDDTSFYTCQSST
ncbi:hypothetical protein HGRIS_000701 [Hohenbuehelia grisea]|uniref:Uncharacterized protein n=1 Tax=Hohenbuehelia grisea TaxID=104357 RepID=A0ABR3JS01_9AGAR